MLAKVILIIEIDRDVSKGNTCVLFLDDESAVYVGLDRVVESRLHLYLAVATTKPINFFFPPQESRQLFFLFCCLSFSSRVKTRENNHKEFMYCS